MLKCLDCLFGLSLFFVVVLCHQGGEDTCREPRRHTPETFLGYHQQVFGAEEVAKRLRSKPSCSWSSLGAPGVAELSPAPWGRCHPHCPITTVFAAAAPGLIPALPTETK